jgi:hypothetical protein
VRDGAADHDCGPESVFLSNEAPSCSI